MLIWPLDSAERAAVFSLLSRRIRPQMVFARHLHVTRWLSVDRIFLEAADPVTDGGPSEPPGSGLRFQPWVSPSVRSRCLQSGCAVGGGGGELFPVKRPCFSRFGDIRTYFVFHELSWFGPWCHEVLNFNDSKDLICHVMSHGSETLVYAIVHPSIKKVFTICHMNLYKRSSAATASVLVTGAKEPLKRKLHYGHLEDLWVRCKNVAISFRSGSAWGTLSLLSRFSKRTSLPVADELKKNKTTTLFIPVYIRLPDR